MEIYLIKRRYGRKEDNGIDYESHVSGKSTLFVTKFTIIKVRGPSLTLASRPSHVVDTPGNAFVGTSVN